MDDETWDYRKVNATYSINNLRIASNCASSALVTPEAFNALKEEVRVLAERVNELLNREKTI